MTIEDELRQIFAVQAELARVPEDPAGRAIWQARAVQRRRALGSGVAAVLVVVLVLGGAVSLQARVRSDQADGAVLGPPMLPTSVSPPLNTTPAPAAPKPSGKPAAAQDETTDDGWRLRLIGLDLRVREQLWSVSGRRYRLTGVGAVTRIYRVPVGWVYGGADQVRLLRPDGTTVRLGSFGPSWVLSPDGDRIAYVRGERLLVHRIVKRGLAAGASVGVPQQAQPVAFAGPNVIISSGAGGLFGALPATEPAEPAWNRTLVSVYGATDERVAGLVTDDSGELCLAALDVETQGLVVTNTGSCRSVEDEDPGAILAPGGGWLAKADAAGTVLVELDRALVDEQATVGCPVISRVTPVWVDGDTLAAADSDHAVRCHTNGSAEYVPLPEGLAADWDFVPSLKPAKAEAGR